MCTHNRTVKNDPPNPVPLKATARDIDLDIVSIGRVYGGLGLVKMVPGGRNIGGQLLVWQLV